MATQQTLASSARSSTEASRQDTDLVSGAGETESNSALLAHRKIPSVQDVAQDTLRHDDSEAEIDTPKRQEPLRVDTAAKVSEEKKDRLVTPTAVDSRQCHYKGKLVILGDISVGKTAIVTRCESNSFRRDQKTTIGVAFTQKVIRTKESVCKFDLWDSAGEERFRSLNTLYFKGAGAGIVVFDVTKRETYQSALDYWIDHLKSHGVENMIIALVGNKCDLQSQHQVTSEEAKQAAEERHVAYFETSAKIGKGITELFIYIAQQVPILVAEHDEDTIGFRITQVATPGPKQMRGTGVARLNLNLSPSDNAGGRCCN